MFVEEFAELATEVVREFLLGLDDLGGGARERGGAEFFGHGEGEARVLAATGVGGGEGWEEARVAFGVDHLDAERGGRGKLQAVGREREGVDGGVDDLIGLHGATEFGDGTGLGESFGGDDLLQGVR